MHHVYLTLGRWTSINSDRELNDISQESLRRITKAYWKGFADDGLHPNTMSTQVLVWDSQVGCDRCHNLIAVYDPQCDKLTVL